MTRRQFLAIILINALVSLAIAVAVVLVAFNVGVEQAVAPPKPYIIVAPTAAALPSPPAATPTPTVPTEEYVVQPGDSLLGIAVRLDVDPALLMELNDITDADRLLVGQRLLVPVDSLQKPAATPAVTMASPTAPPLAETATVSLEITGSQAITGTTPIAITDPGSITGAVSITGTTPVTATLLPGKPVILAVLAPGDLPVEAVSLANIGQAPVRLRNWSLRRPDGRRYMFPDVTLAPSGELLLYSRQGADADSTLFWGLRQAAWSPGDTVILADQAGQTVASFTAGE